MSFFGLVFAEGSEGKLGDDVVSGGGGVNVIPKEKFVGVVTDAIEDESWLEVSEAGVFGVGDAEAGRIVGNVANNFVDVELGNFGVGGQ